MRYFGHKVCHGLRAQKTTVYNEKAGKRSLLRRKSCELRFANCIANAHGGSCPKAFGGEISIFVLWSRGGSSFNFELFAMKNFPAIFLLACLSLCAGAMALAGTTLNVGEVDHARILAAASNALSIAPITITQYRAALSDGGPHDYYSNGDYWWPNPKTTNGLPYVQQDGQTNPNNFNHHRDCLRQLHDAVAALGAKLIKLPATIATPPRPPNCCGFSFSIQTRA